MATSPQMRDEEDLLGHKGVPADAYYGVHTERAKENFRISRRTVGDYPEFVRSMVEVKKAEALANEQLLVLPHDVADSIVNACDQILTDGKCMDQFPVDIFQGGAGTSVNMNTNEVVANLALENMGHHKGEYSVINPNDHVNKSQSTNDSYPTGLRLAVYKMLQPLLSQLTGLAESFRQLAVQNKDAIKMGRTQLQDAVPMTVGEEFDAFRSLIQGEIDHLGKESSVLLEVNLGGTAIGTGLNTPDGFPEVVAEKLKDVTGLPIVSAPNLIEATSDATGYVTVHSALKRTAVTLSKICNDLRLLSSGPRAGLAEIRLPEVQAGSSIMPAKVNPVIPEVMNQICFKVFGNDLTVTFAAEAGQLQLNVMEPVIAQSLFESIELLTSGVRTLRERCVDGIVVNRDRCRQYVMNSIGIVTYLNDLIGHHQGDLVGKECAKTGKSVREVVLEKGLLTEEQLDDAFSDENLMRPQYMGAVYPEPARR